MKKLIQKMYNNMLSIGRHPEELGVVGNVIVLMVEQVDGVSRWFNVDNASEPEYRFWQDALPLWISAERAGLRTAVHSWFGADVRYRSCPTAHLIEMIS